MPYALLVYDHDDSLDALSDQQRDAVYGEYVEFGRTDGVSGYRLAPPVAANTLRIERGRRYVRPGPFTDQRPAIVGFYVLAPTIVKRRSGWPLASPPRDSAAPS